MKREFLSFCKISLILVFSLMIISVINVKQAQSYYGGMYGGYSGLLGGYGGLYGGYGGLYGGGYGGLYGGYGGLYGGGYGGLYGGYGGSSLLSSLYGGYGGLYGSSMLGGATSPFGLQNMYYTVQTGNGLNYQVPFLQIAPLLGMAGLYNSLFPSLFGSGSTSAYGRAPRQVITALYSALVADPLLGPVLLANPLTLDILAADITLAAVVAANSLWLSYHGWQVLPPNIPVAQPLLLSKMAVSCTQCHSNVNSGALLAVFPLPTALI